MKLNRSLLIIGALLGALAIVMGAFGAHGLKEKLSPDAMDNYETAVRYMIYHVLALLFSQNFTAIKASARNTISILFLAGILFFSGSIFLIALGLVEAGSIWFITPIGGILFVSGWLSLAYNLIKNR